MAAALSRSKKQEVREITQMRHKILSECAKLEETVQRREKLREFLSQKEPAKISDSPRTAAASELPTRPSFADSDPLLYQRILKLVEMLRQQSLEVDKRLYSLETEVLDVIQKLVAANESPGGSNKAPDLNCAESPIHIYNDTSADSVEDGVDALKEVDMDIGRGPDRTVRGTAVFSLLNF